MEKPEKNCSTRKKKPENFIGIIKIMLSIIFLNLYIAISEFTLE